MSSYCLHGVMQMSGRCGTPERGRGACVHPHPEVALFRLPQTERQRAPCVKSFQTPQSRMRAGVLAVDAYLMFAHMNVAPGRLP